MSAEENYQNETKKYSRQKKLYFKVGFILLLIVLLLIPNAFISDLIHERSRLQYSTQDEIAKTWGGHQLLSGPVLVIPYKTSYKSSGAETATVFSHKLYLAPDEVVVDTEVATQERKKSIYSTTLFTSKNKIQSEFTVPDSALFGKNVSSIDWNEASLFIPINDPSAISSGVFLQYENDKVKMTLGNDSSLGKGIVANINVEGESKANISADIEIRGSQYLNYQPTGSENKVAINCDWPSPGFEGSLSPADRNISATGFNARWTASEYNRAIPKVWMDKDFTLRNSDSTFGVRLVQTVDHYQKNLRSVKYALLIISLSFLTFFFYEILKGSKVHPLQYILIGLALSLFYLLLLSFSEHVGFSLAYIIASIGTVGLITWYSGTILREGRGVGMLGATLGGLYVYIYILLQMEDYALLAGSIGLFVILFIVMYLSRKMDWYEQ